MILYVAVPINGNEEHFMEKCQRNTENIKRYLSEDNHFKQYEQVISAADVCPVGFFTMAQLIGLCAKAVLESDAIFTDVSREEAETLLFEYDTCRRYKIPMYGLGWRITWEE